MSAPTRRQLMAGSLAALGAAGAPAVAVAAKPARKIDPVINALDGLPDEIKIMVHLNRISKMPDADKRAFMAEFRTLDLGAEFNSAVERKLWS